MNLRRTTAIISGKAAGFLARFARLGGGSNLPGRIAIRIDRSLISSLAARLTDGRILITGTNGKTTTSALVAALLELDGRKHLHNRSGANLVPGIASVLLRGSDLRGNLEAESGLFEVDEAAFPHVVRETSPGIVLVNNLFRDQLDRYGELDTLADKLRAAVKGTDADTVVALNTDDPLVANIGRGLEQQVVYYGIEGAGALAMPGTQGASHASDSTQCPECGNPLTYDHFIFAHMGSYHCGACGLRRPTPTVHATDLRIDGMNGTRCTVTYPGGSIVVHIPIPGIYNVYNVLAAVAISVTLGIPGETMARAVEGFSAAFGRVERIRIGDRDALMILAKNPTGFNEVLRTLSPEPGTRELLIALNDRAGDGRDISWIWDTDFEMTQGMVSNLTCSGTRGWEMALRAKYADAGPGPVSVVPDLEQALDLALEKAGPESTLYIIPTYTAMLSLRRILAKRGLVDHYWEG